MKLDQQQRILSCMTEVLNQNGYHAEVVNQPDLPPVLHCEAAWQGKKSHTVSVECCFIPMQLPEEHEGLLQFFLTLFCEAQPQSEQELRRALNYCTEFCPVGAFGYYTEAGQVYLRYNTLLDGALTLDQIIHLFADNLSLLLASASRFIDGLAAIALEGATLEQVIAAQLFPELVQPN